MTTGANGLAEILGRAARDGDDVCGYLWAAREAGHTLSSAASALLGARETDDGRAILDGSDGVRVLLMAILELSDGDLDAAQAVVDATPGLADGEARDVWERERAYQRAASLIRGTTPAADIVDALGAAALEPGHRAALVADAARRLTVEQIVELAQIESPPARELAREVLSVRPPVDLLDAAGVADPSPLLRGLVPALARGYSTGGVDPVLALAEAHARSLVERVRPLRAVMAWVSRERPIAAWLPVLRHHGLGATAAALHLVERSAPGSPVEIAGLLRDAGYSDDDILRALLENGLGAMRTLRVLAQTGWSVDRLVASLCARGALLPEVRDDLLELGLSRAAVEDVLLRHAEADVVVLVMSR